jgi:hypothetical protein
MRELIDLTPILEQAASKIAKEDYDPEKWDTAVIFLLQALEEYSLDRAGGLDAYMNMLEKVRTAIEDRLEESNW